MNYKQAFNTVQKYYISLQIPSSTELANPNRYPSPITVILTFNLAEKTESKDWGYLSLQPPNLKT